MSAEQSPGDAGPDPTLEAGGSRGLPGAGQLLAVLALASVLSVAAGVGYALTLLPEVRERRIHANEAAAVEGLTQIKTAQTLFREGDYLPPPHRYGDLEELEAAGVLTRGYVGQPRNGYLFDVAPGADPARTWWAKASPQFPDRTGRRYFFVNEAGMVYTSESDFLVPPARPLPESLKPIGQ